MPPLISDEQTLMFTCPIPMSPSDTECCEQLPETDRSACRKAYSFGSYQRIRKTSVQNITAELTDNAMEGESGIGEMSETDPCDITENCMLYILESTPEPNISTRIYTVHGDFELPVNSGWVSNSNDENNVPEIIVEETTGPYDFVISATNPNSHYQLANIKIDSRGTEPPLGVMDLRGAGFVSLDGIEVIRDPVEGYTRTTFRSARSVHAIRMGCIDGGTSEYRINNSEIDLTQSLTTRSGSSRRRTYSYYTGSAIHFNDCAGKTKLLFKDTNILVSLRRRDLPELTSGPLTGAVFSLRDTEGLAVVEILEGSTCNNVYLVSEAEPRTLVTGQSIVIISKTL